MIDDLKFAWRSLRNAPGFTLVAVTTLALAIGANAAIFSIADAVLFRKLPYTDPESVYVLHMLNRENGRRFGLLPYQYLQVIDAGHAGLTTVGMLENLASAVAEGESGAEFVPMVAVTANYFELLGVAAARGRVFDSRDESAEGRPAMLTYSSWQSRFGGDPTVSGRAVRVGSTTFDVVGVLPKSFVFPSIFAGKPELIVVMPPVRPGTAGGAVNPIVRLEPGVTREQAQAELDALLAPVAAAQPKPTASLPVLDDVRSVLYPVGQPVMRFLLAAAGCVLLIACINLANMLMARGERRRRETGVRAALGANRRRLIMPLVFEALVIGFAAAALAVLTTSATFEALLRHVPPLAYGNAPVGVDLRVASFAMVLGLFAAFSFAIIPAWRSARVDVRALIDKGRATTIGTWKILDRPLVAIQVALAVVLVFSAAMVGRAFLNVLRVPLGFSPDNVIVVNVRPAPLKDPGLKDPALKDPALKDPALQAAALRAAALQAFYRAAMETIGNRGDVLSAGAVGVLPLSGAAPTDGAAKEGSREFVAGILHVLPGYFETIGIGLVRGRLPAWSDVDNPDAAVLSEGAAKALLGDQEPIGATFQNTRGRRFSVIGVVADVRNSVDREPSPTAYVMADAQAGVLTLVARTRTPDSSVLADLKRQVSGLAPGRPVSAEWWSSSIARITAYRNPRFQSLVLGAFATLALGLTALGIFGVVAFLVAARQHEMGVRLAIGATPHSLVRLMVNRALAPVVIGLVVGVFATRWAARLADSRIIGLDTRDPSTLVVAGLTVLIAATVAAYLPARRAAQLDPVVVLRSE